MEVILQMVPLISHLNNSEKISWKNSYFKRFITLEINCAVEIAVWRQAILPNWLYFYIKNWIWFIK